MNRFADVAQWPGPCFVSRSVWVRIPPSALLALSKSWVYDMNMKNKLKIVAVVVAVVVGMVLYKNHHDKHNKDEKKESKSRAKAQTKDLPN